MTCINHGQFSLTYGVGVELENKQTHCTIYFQPGDDSASFLDDFEARQAAQPERDIGSILADLFREYEV